MKRLKTRSLLTSIPLALFLAPFLGGCTLGPDFVRPSLTPSQTSSQTIPAEFREAAGWKLAAPADTVSHAPWWEGYGDAMLNDLVKRVEIANQNVAQATAQYRAAAALLAGSRAAWFPGLGSSFAVTRSQGETGASSTTFNPARTLDRLALNSSWEIDLWGRIGRSVEAAQSSLDASAADLAAARLSMQATLTQAYLQLRINDAQQRLLQRAITAQRRSYQITYNRREAGIVTSADLAQAETQLKTTEAQAIDLGVQRAQLEHLIAQLIGEIPGQFRIAAVDSVPALPTQPVGIPSALLEGRPDIAAAERRVAAANAQIGVAQAAFFPNLTLSASGGYQNAGLTDLITWPHRFWSLGPAIALSLFDGGARSAAKEQAIANYDRTVAGYRQSVLNAFQEVEDNLAALRILEEESAVQAQARRAANEFERLTNNQYMAGTVSFLNVATAQTASLSAERTSLDLLGRQLTASVALNKALGGNSWTLAGETLVRQQKAAP
jgi:NodT family efflux transporter outer membrane factor (OMF) lipoprotein